MEVDSNTGVVEFVFKYPSYAAHVQVGADHHDVGQALSLAVGQDLIALLLGTGGTRKGHHALCGQPFVFQELFAKRI